MNRAKELEFISVVTPLFKTLASHWVKPGLKSPDGYHYGCLYCDMECGGTERHDIDCLAELAKRTVEEFESIDSDLKYEIDHKGNKRPEKDSEELRTLFKVQHCLSSFYSVNLYTLIPVDYSLNSNKNIGCYCNFQENKPSHQEDCLVQGLAKALSSLYKVEE